MVFYADLTTIITIKMAWKFYFYKKFSKGNIYIVSNPASLSLSRFISKKVPLKVIQRFNLTSNEFRDHFILRFTSIPFTTFQLILASATPPANIYNQHFQSPFFCDFCIFPADVSKNNSRKVTMNNYFLKKKTSRSNF